MMRSVNNSVDTVSAAASAIASAESRIQPTTIQKKRWGSCWSLYWCFGSRRNGKRIGHAVLVSEPVVSGTAVAVASNASNQTSILMPFIAPPSSPASFLQSDPPSATQSPAGLLSLTSPSVNAYSPCGPASIFAIGPYAHETQLVTPPVFSALATEPSTAPFTPPPESVQLTTPSSPEVPFAQLVTSSLERASRNSGINQKFGLSHYDFRSHHVYPVSPGGNLISPGSVISNSGTSSPFPDRCPILELRTGEAPKIFGFEHFTTSKWGSRLGSGSLTPDGLGSGCVTPDGMGLNSRWDSGSMTPDGFLVENRISEASFFANPAYGPKNDETIVDHRVSFELSGEDVARCLKSKSFASYRTLSEYPIDSVAEDRTDSDVITKEVLVNYVVGKIRTKQLRELQEKLKRSIVIKSIVLLLSRQSKSSILTMQKVKLLISLPSGPSGGRTKKSPERKLSLVKTGLSFLCCSHRSTSFEATRTRYLMDA